MDLKELLELLEISDPSDFSYFEDLAGILESDEDIPQETLRELFNQTDHEVVADLIGNYFDDLLEGLPDESTDMYLLIENIKRMLQGLTMVEDESHNFAEELDRFRRWYCFDRQVECEPMEEGKTKSLPVREAVALSRLQKLGGEEYQYDFDACLDYPLDEYVVDLAAAARLDEEEDEDLADLEDSSFLS